MRATQILVGAFVYLAAAAYAQQCNQGGAFFSCADGQIACNTVSANDIKLGLDQTAKQIGGFGSAQVWLTRSVKSATRGNLNALCNKILASCCNGVTHAQKSTIPLQAGEQGSVQLIPA